MADLPVANIETTGALGGAVGGSTDMAPNGKTTPEPVTTTAAASASSKAEARLNEGLKQGGGT